MSKKWIVDFKPRALKELNKLDKKTRNKIFNFLDSLIEDFDSPRVVGKALKGGLHGLWSYRIGNYRMICHLQDNALIVLVTEVGHRKDVYDVH